MSVISYGSKQSNIQKIFFRKPKEGFKYNCPHAYNTSLPYTVNLDWLQLGVSLADGASGLELGEDFTRGKYRYVCAATGTQHYKYRYDIYKGNDLHYSLEVCPRNKGAKDELNSILKLENWLLYADWHTELTAFIATNIKEVLRISRVDIAVDGANHIYNLMCDYMTGKSDTYGVKMLGKSKITAHEINRLTRRPKGFSIGSKKGNKQIAIYNKTQDIVRTSKNYIRDFWGLNGLDITAENYRFEMRVKNNFLRQLSGDMLPADYTPLSVLNLLKDTAFQLDLVRKSCDSFFDWVYIDDINATRCTPVNLLGFPSYDFKRTPLVYNGTAYKAKMQVHNTFFQVAKEIVGIEEGIAIISKQLETYELHDWYTNRMHDFAKRYRTQTPDALESLLKCSLPTSRSSLKIIKDRMREIYFSQNAKQLKLKHKS